MHKKIYLLLNALFCFLLLQAPSQAQLKLPEAVRLPVDLAKVEFDSPLYYGVYMQDSKVGWAESIYIRTEFKGQPVICLRETTHMELVSMGKQVNLTSENRTMFEDKEPYGLVAITKEISTGQKVEIVRETDGFTAHISAGGQKIDKELGPLDFNLADVVTPEEWVRSGPAAGDSIATRYFLVETMSVNSMVYTVSDVTKSLAQGVAMTVYNLDMEVSPLGISGVARLDGQGVLLSFDLGGAMELRLESEEVAKRLDAGMDLFVRGMLKPDKPLGDPYSLLETRLLVKGPNAEMLRTRPSQTAEPVEGGVLLTLGVDNSADFPVEPDEVEALTKATTDFPANHAEAVRLVAEALGDDPDSTMTEAEKVSQLLAFTRDYIEDEMTPSNLSFFDIVKDKTGDCSEHSLFFITLARAAGIPAVMATGWLWMGDEAGAFGGHAWAMVGVNGKWMGVDPTMGLMPVGGAHLMTGYGLDGVLKSLTIAKDLTLEVKEAVHAGAQEGQEPAGTAPAPQSDINTNQ